MYQKLILVGNLGKEPEMRYTKDGTAVTTFSLATGRFYNDKVETTWWRVSVWGKQAESCNQYLGKGSKVVVEGRLRCDPTTGGPQVYEKKDKSGFASSFEVYAEAVRFLSKKGETEEDDGIEVDDIPG